MESVEHNLRGTVIIDPRCIGRHIGMNNPDVGHNIEDVIRLVKGHKFAAEPGEVYPVQWQEGGGTIKPDVHKSKKSFNKHEAVFLFSDLITQGKQ